MSAAVLTVADMYNPFRALHLLGPSVTMSVEPTPGNKPAWWCPVSDHFMLRPDLNQVQRRCHMAHELAHRDLGHSGEEDGRLDRRQEREADELAARRLVTLDALVRALTWSDNGDEVADALWVTRHILDVRIETMYGGERRQVAVALAKVRD
ncbi:MAG: hypothetical protein JWO15_3860 [Sphingomonadales bacterium]|nr:hypothetical protein [Sphingomonadales bacterium]